MSRFLTLGLTALVLASAAAAPAAEKDSVVLVTVSEMCGGCVKKITAKLQPMSEVAEVKCDVAAKTVTVTPSAQGVSPRVLWDALDSIGKTPQKMVTSQGTFTEQPRN